MTVHNPPFSRLGPSDMHPRPLRKLYFPPFSKVHLLLSSSLLIPICRFSGLNFFIVGVSGFGDNLKQYAKNREFTHWNYLYRAGHIDQSNNVLWGKNMRNGTRKIRKSEKRKRNNQEKFEVKGLKHVNAKVARKQAKRCVRSKPVLYCCGRG
jgi:hypothetical protein